MMQLRDAVKVGPQVTLVSDTKQAITVQPSYIMEIYVFTDFASHSATALLSTD